jgi:hypothetical protein
MSIVEKMQQVKKNQKIKQHYKIIALSSLAGILTFIMTIIFSIKKREKHIKENKNPSSLYSKIINKLLGK